MFSDISLIFLQILAFLIALALAIVVMTIGCTAAFILVVKTLQFCAPVISQVWSW